MSRPVQAAPKTGSAFWQEDGSLSHPCGVLSTMTVFWHSLEQWWSALLTQTAPPPPTQCPTCDRGQRIGVITAALFPPQTKIGLPPHVFEIEFCGHPHHLTKKTTGNLILVRDITQEQEQIRSVHEDINQYESICNFIEDVYYRIDLKGRLQFISPSCQKLLLYRPKELLGRSLVEVSASADYLEELLEIIKKTDSVTDFDMVLECKQGRQVPVSLTAQIVCNKKGKRIGVEGILRDISEREKLDTLLVERTRQFQESMARLEFQKTAADQHLLVSVSDPTGNITYVNDNLVETSHYSREELIGNPFDFLSTHSSSFFKEMWQTISGGKIWQGEVKNQKKNGDPFWVKLTITPFLTVSGQPFQYISTATDISDQRQTISRLEENRKFLHHIVNAIGDGIYVLDLQGQLLSLNKEGERLLGWQEDELLHRNFHEMVHHTRQDGTPFKTVDCTLHQSLLGRTFRKEEEYFIQKNGAFLPVSLVTSPLVDGTEIIGSVAIFQDSSMRKRQLKELEEACATAVESSRLKSEFLANMSHEIRTPMNAIVGMNELLIDTALTDEQYGFSEIIKESSLSLLALINDILDFSKIEAGKMDIEEIDFSPVSVVEGSAELLSGLANEKELSLATYISPQIPETLRGDPGRLRQMLINLINNALKFTEEGEVVVRANIHAETNKQMTIRFSVTDTGIGLSKYGRQHLFDPFTQAEQNTSTKYLGTGLGLAISKRLAELMNGTIGVEGEEGEGSTFWFQIPFHYADQRKIREKPSFQTKNLRNPRVLSVMENSTDQEILKLYFMAWDVELHHCFSWKDALSAIRISQLKEEPFDGVILTTELSDERVEFISIPGLLEEESLLGETHLIAFMERDDKEQKELILESGYRTALAKPVQQSEWIGTLTDLINPVPAEPEVEAMTSREEPVTSPIIGPDSYDALEEGKLLLVVEDNLINQKVTILQLKKMGYAAHTVNNGKEAVEAMTHLPYALILMDCQMPVMDGFEATHVIRKLDQISSRHTPIIAMTANAMKGDRERCLESGMDDYLSKPVAPETLLKKLKYWIPKGHGDSSPIEINQLRQLFGNDDSMIRELLHHFLPSTEALLGRLWEAIRNREQANLTEAAIELHEACSNLGASPMAQLAKKIEWIAENKRWEEAEEIMDELYNAIEKVEVFISGF
ncbi:MAG: PAS domain S-box protein [Magnetococcales bacterium]|nr:PAS domain S-box protein [Magnetococcales bacterium]